MIGAKYSCVVPSLLTADPRGFLPAGMVLITWSVDVSITLTVDADGLPALKRRMQEIRRELLDEFDARETGVQVVQVNFQLFPLSKRTDMETEGS